MKGKIHSVVSNDLKEVQILEEKGWDCVEVQILEEKGCDCVDPDVQILEAKGSGCTEGLVEVRSLEKDDPDSKNYFEEQEYIDEAEEAGLVKDSKISNFLLIYKIIEEEDLALALKLDSDLEIERLSYNILVFLEHGNTDGPVFSEMVSNVLGIDTFSKELSRACEMNCSIHYFVKYFGGEHRGTANELSRIYEDWFFKEAIKEREEHSFFKTMKERDTKTFVRGAFCIILSYCITKDYLLNMGLWWK